MTYVIFVLLLVVLFMNGWTQYMLYDHNKKLTSGNVKIYNSLFKEIRELQDTADNNSLILDKMKAIAIEIQENDKRVETLEELISTMKADNSNVTTQDVGEIVTEWLYGDVEVKEDNEN